MRRLRSAPLALLFAGTGLAAGPPPIITGVDPSPLVSIAKTTVYDLTIHGRNFWPSGPNDPNRRVLSVWRSGQASQAIKIYSMTDTVINTELPTVPLLNTAGALAVMVTIDGMHSNVFGVKIVDDPPKLDSVSPEKITLGGAADDPRWKVWLRGSRWIPDTSIWINGTNVGNCLQNLNSGQEQLTWPPSLRKVGRYSVSVLTAHGRSDVRTVDVVAPAPAPAPMPGATAPTGVVAVRYGPKQVSVSWAKTNTDTYYRIERRVVTTGPGKTTLYRGVMVSEWSVVSPQLPKLPNGYNDTPPAMKPGESLQYRVCGTFLTFPQAKCSDAVDVTQGSAIMSPMH